MQYFSHDACASDDEKIMMLRLDHGGAAVDAYWCLLEAIYRNERPLDADMTRADMRVLAHKLCVGPDELGAWVGSMVSLGLLESDGETLMSARAREAIEDYSAHAEVSARGGRASGAARKRGRPRVQKSVEPEGENSGKPVQPENADSENPVQPEAGNSENPVEPKKENAANPVQPENANARTPVEPIKGEEKKREEKRDPTESVGSSAPAHAGPALVLLDPAPEARRAAPPRYDPPTPAEVAEFVAASGGYPIDSEAFCGWYSDHGWPPNGWHGSAMRWSREERDRAARSPREVSADDLAYLDGGAVAV